MSVPVGTAEQILRRRYGEPVKAETDYVIGFRTSSGRVLALHRAASETRLWFLPPAPVDMEGVRLIPYAKNSNLNGPLAALGGSATLRAEIATEGALNRFLDWYAGPITKAASSSNDSQPALDSAGFRQVFERFQRLITARDKGHPFTNFQEGLAATWEDYKPKLRDHALTLLASDTWSGATIGSGEILRHVIDAIEIQDSRRNLTNNLVFWQNRFGHASRNHRVFIEAQTNPKLRKEIERLLFALYVGGGDEGKLFEELSVITGRKYPLLAYLYFLKDIDRFTPIHPTGFDRAFGEMGVDFSVRGQCTWENYSAFVTLLRQMIPQIEQQSGSKSVRLIDAHSFTWIFAELTKLETEGELVPAGGSKDDGRVLGAMDRSIVDMRQNVENTVKNSNGQLVQRTLKNKELRITSQQLEALIRQLLVQQDNRCALTGIPFQFLGQHEDKNLLPSLDRKDSNGHYEEGNLQVVCQFINFWKGDADNEDFRRLLNLVRGIEEQ
ncbi:hypothetical protein GFM11_17980 [Rhizobium leguminosarum bv. viciae]|uniref:hypothetical protein n=1 Tax=Rhizobium leguminosarum TaxID=384 RepID=UPI001038FEF1|nr:hypothetical protein [Rhizobium leguminosarum]NKK15126.1 hypothetical protein [Rhizobium leguminosarum bv. viciae]TBZ56447.1 hypothetical protein E0H48_18065 [Rhizobium leguminosarum bv. viciae]